MINYNIGDKVAFSKNVITRTMDAASARGIILSIKNNIAAIEFNGTWVNHEDGGTIRHVPIKNIIKILATGAILD